VIPGKGGSGQRGMGGGIDKRGEAGGVPSPGEQHQPHSSNPTHSPPPLFRSPWWGINTSPYSHAAILHGTPKTEPQMLGFGILFQTPPPTRRVGEHTPPLPPPCHQLAPTTSNHHPMTPFHAAPPKLSLKCLVLAFWSKSHPLTQRVGERTPPLPPPCHQLAPTTSHHHPTLPFYAAPWNRATNAWFLVFGPNPAPKPRIGERASPTLPPCHQHAPTASHHHPTPPFYTAPPKPSYRHSIFEFLAQPLPPGLALANAQPHHRLHIINTHSPPPSISCFTQCAQNRAMNALFSGFGLNPHPLALHWQTRSPPAASKSSTCIHHLPVSSHIAVSHGMPETEQQTRGFGI
jgi:hypothetical protein